MDLQNNYHLYAFTQHVIDILEDGCVWRNVPRLQNDSADGKALSQNNDELPTLDHVTREIYVCQQCQLSQTRTNTVPGMGVHNPLVLVVGEGPGEQEDIQGKPFVGKSGMYLDKWLQAIGLSRTKNVFIANIVKCRPPQNRNPRPDEIAACSKYLKLQVAILKPRLILAVGKVAGNALTGNQEAKIAWLRSQVFSYEDIPLYVTYHPSAVLRNPELRRPVWDDMQKIQHALNSIK